MNSERISPFWVNGYQPFSADYKYYQTLGLKLIHRGLFRQYNYGLPLKELEV